MDRPARHGDRRRGYGYTAYRMVDHALHVGRGVRRGGARGAVHHPQVRGLQTQADLFDRAFARRAHQRDLLGTEGQARREHRRGADGLGRHQRPGDRPAERGRVLPQAISGQRGPRTENPDIQYPGIYFDAAGRRAGGRTDQPQIPRTRREEHRPSDQHRQRPRHHFETRKQHEQAQSGAIRRGGAGQGDRRAGRDGGRQEGDPDFGQGDRQPAFALLGAGRQTLHRAGVRQPDHQLDPLRQGGRADPHPLPRHAG